MPCGRLLTTEALAGLLFMGFGALGLGLGAGIPAGTADAMEAGYVPRLVSLLLLIGGALPVALSLARPATAATPPPDWHWRPLLLVTASAVAFALLLRPLGFILALVAAVALGNAAGRMLGPLRMLLLAAVLAGLNVAVFRLALGLPIPLWPHAWPGGF